MTSTIDFSDFKCRSSGIVKILSTKKGCAPISEAQLARIKELEERTKALTPAMALELTGLKEKRDRPPEVILSDTCIEYMMEVYAWETQGMIAINKETLDVMQLRKGKMAEGEAKELLCLVDKQLYQVHKERIFNDYLTGEIDTFLGESVYKATNVTDIKNSFDYPTFLKKINNGLENGQTEQLQGYGDITGAGELYIANCLVNNPQDIIDEMMWRVLKKVNAATTESPEFLEKWDQFDRSMVFDKIPRNQRVFKIKIEPFTKEEQQKVYDRVKYCRDWLNNFHESHQKMNL